jgi:hypothetical protein
MLFLSEIQYIKDEKHIFVLIIVLQTHVQNVKFFITFNNMISMNAYF